MIIDPHHHDYVYKAIIALNNSGVYLVQHGLYVEAIETLKDSMRFMKETFFTNDSIEGNRLEVLMPSSTTVFDRSEYVIALQSACIRKSHVRFSTNTEETSHMKEISITIISDQDHPSKAYDTLVQHCSNKTSFCCVTIDPIPNYDHISSDNSDQLQQEAAVILYNLGIAFRCVARVTSHHTATTSTPTPANITTWYLSRIENSNVAFQLMELTHTLTYKMLEELSLSGVVLANLPLNLLLASLLVLFNLQQMSSENAFLFNQQIHYTFVLEHIAAAIKKRAIMMTGNGEHQTHLRAPAA